MQEQSHTQNNLWNTLPSDVYSLILRNTDVPTLFRVRELNRRSRNAVRHFLQTVSAPTLFRFLPCFDGEFANRLDSPEWHKARSQILALQLLAFKLNTATRWQPFNTIESGVVATMLCPLQESAADQLLALVGTEGEIMPSEMLSHEIHRLTQRYGEERLQTLAERFKTFYQGLESPENTIVRIQHNAQHEVLAVTIMRATTDIHLQDLLVDCLCCEENNFTKAMQQLRHYVAFDANHLSELLHWIIQPSAKTQEAIEEALATQDEKMINATMQRFLYSVFHANWYDASFGDALETIKNNQRFQYNIHGIRHCGYTQMCCTILYDSWDKGHRLFQTLTGHVTEVARHRITGYDLRNNPASAFSNSSFVSRQRGPLSGEYSFMVGTQYSGSEERADAIRRFKRERPNSADGEYQYLERGELILCTLANSCLDQSDFSYQYFDTGEIKNMAINETQFNETIFLRGQFDHVRLSNNSFTQGEFISCTFNRCRFDNNNFANANFSVSVDSPTIFTFCQLEANSFQNVTGKQHIRFIDCAFTDNASPNPAYVYNTATQDDQRCEFYRELFQQAVQKRDMSMIKWIQSNLFSLIHGKTGHYNEADKKQYYHVTPEQDQICREVFSYQTETLPWLVNTLSFGQIEAPTSTLSSYLEHVQVIGQPERELDLAPQRQ